MNKDTSTIFRESVDVVMNARRFDKIMDYYHKDCRFHMPPYVGLGLLMDDSSGERMVVKRVSPGSPAEAHLKPGDELVHAQDTNGEWSSFQELKTGLWGQGKLGTSVTLTIRRNNEFKEIRLTRAKIEGDHLQLSDILDGWRSFLEKDWPDLRAEINQLVAQTDRVAYFITNSGTNSDYKQSAIWTESGIVRLKDDKIIDWWSTSDDLSQIRQLGYKLTAPVSEKEKVKEKIVSK